MAKPKAAGNTPANVAKLATLPRALRSGGLTLIGLFGPDKELSALVRDASGRIRQIETGQNLITGRVAGIDADGVMLEKGGRTWRLAMPAKAATPG